MAKRLTKNVFPAVKYSRLSAEQKKIQRDKTILVFAWNMGLKFTKMCFLRRSIISGVLNKVIQASQTILGF
jgi:hypothetical protein